MALFLRAINGSGAQGWSRTIVSGNRASACVPIISLQRAGVVGADAHSAPPLAGLSPCVRPRLIGLEAVDGVRRVTTGALPGEYGRSLGTEGSEPPFSQVRVVCMCECAQRAGVLGTA
jgi:hypothetical protein